MVYKHAYLNTLLLLHSAFMLSVVKMPLKGEVGGRALNSHGYYIVDHGKSCNNCVFEFLWEPFGQTAQMCRLIYTFVACMQQSQVFCPQGAIIVVHKQILLFFRHTFRQMMII